MILESGFYVASERKIADVFWLSQYVYHRCAMLSCLFKIPRGGIHGPFHVPIAFTIRSPFIVLGRHQICVAPSLRLVNTVYSNTVPYHVIKALVCR